MKNINHTLWANYDTFAGQRGMLIRSVLESHIRLSQAQILDFGCGSGGIALQMARAGAHVTALDIVPAKLAELAEIAARHELDIKTVDDLPASAEYDAVLLVDVLEHLRNPVTCLQQITSVLKPGGLLYASTPNKVAVLNVLCDPHYSLPLVSLLNRSQVKRLIVNILRWQANERSDFPQLFEYSRLHELFRQAGLYWQWVNCQVADYAFSHPESLWNRPWHLKLVKTMIQSTGTQAFMRLISDHPGFFNKWLNPTWFILAKKPGGINPYPFH
ncbi:MAG: class I SAM-dependent methyltransferase [candidate division KSB1 bacterium]|nr:class I SAM-dependent methyltransferase [candidate division KSB1 bacterium]